MLSRCMPYIFTLMPTIKLESSLIPLPNLSSHSMRSWCVQFCTALLAGGIFTLAEAESGTCQCYSKFKCIHSWEEGEINFWPLQNTSNAHIAQWLLLKISRFRNYHSQKCKKSVFDKEYHPKLFGRSYSPSWLIKANVDLFCGRGPVQTL